MPESATPDPSAPAGCTDPALAGTAEAVAVTYHHIRTREILALTGTFTCWQRLRSGPKRGEPGATLRLEDGEIRIVPVSLLTGASRQLLGEPNIPMKPGPGPRRR
ncbi:MAG TPA: hypothetical protein VHG28_15185 [Longimicrobiaceae bacterium]|nr:hypothetical protein [Longimicrobiaceae bacterium]